MVNGIRYRRWRVCLLYYPSTSFGEDRRSDFCRPYTSVRHHGLSLQSGRPILGRSQPLSLSGSGACPAGVPPDGVLPSELVPSGAICTRSLARRLRRPESKSGPVSVVWLYYTFISLYDYGQIQQSVISRACVFGERCRRNSNIMTRHKYQLTCI